MKFKHIHIKNFQQLVPRWACDVFALARTLDEQLGTPEGRMLLPRGTDVFSSLGFWVEADFSSDSPEEWSMRGCTPDDGVDLCGRLIIITKSVCGSGAQVDVPLNPLLKGYVNIEGSHSLYCHSFQTETPIAYIGITKRPWHKRLSQHIASAKSGSRYLFHRALREHAGTAILHRVLLCELDQDQAFDLEEEFVEMMSLYPLGLNMIPGGSAGIRYLHKLGIDARNASERDKAVIDLAERETLEGRPNPLCAARWASDPDFVERVICGHSGRLTAEQVRTIRLHASFGFSAEKIKDLVGARNIRQVNGVLSEKHYSRIIGGDK